MKKFAILFFFAFPISGFCHSKKDKPSIFISRLTSVNLLQTNQSTPSYRVHTLHPQTNTSIYLRVQKAVMVSNPYRMYSIRGGFKAVVDPNTPSSTATEQHVFVGAFSIEPVLPALNEQPLLAPQLKVRRNQLLRSEQFEIRTAVEGLKIELLVPEDFEITTSTTRDPALLDSI